MQVLLAHRIMKSCVTELKRSRVVLNATQHKPTFPLLELSEELILHILKGTTLRAKNLGVASISCSGIKRLSRVTAQMRLRGVMSLAQLHLHEIMGHLSRDDELLCALFCTASFVLVSKKGIKAAANLMLQHPQMTCQVDGHVHIGAPDMVAVYYAKKRAQVRGTHTADTDMRSTSPHTLICASGFIFVSLFAVDLCVCGVSSGSHWIFALQVSSRPLSRS